MVARGYKDTEIGVIPVEWDAIELGDIATFSKGKGISKKDISEDGVKCIRYGELFTTYNEIITTIKSKTNSTTNMVYSKINDTLMPTSDVTPNGLATASALNKEGVILGGDILIIRSKDILNSYLSYFIRSHKKQIMKLVSGSTVYHIYANDMKKLKIPLPQLKEQEKIADILSTADAKIDAIASQIEKAQTLKKGLLQKLLSEGIGHSEFKDSELGKIPKSWEVAQLKDVCKINGRIGYRGYTVEDIVKEGQGAITLSPSNINDNNLSIEKSTYISWFKYEESPEIQIFNDDILFVKTGSTYGKTVIVKNLLEKATINPQIIVLKAISMNNLLLSYLMASPIIQRQVEQTVAGGAIPTLSQKNIYLYDFPLPPLKEQKQIAEILSTADEKLEVLRAKKEKYETLKKGLLQKLLSGEVRV